MTQMFAGCEVTRKLYEGTHTVVYQARRADDGVPVVLKTLREDYPAPRRISLFRHEHDILLRLDTDAVVRPLGLQREAGNPVMVLEDFGGRSLRNLRLAGQLSVAELLNLALHITTALGEVHRFGVVHKDLNPSNILLNPHTGVVKLIDFGISSLLANENAAFTSAGRLEGTLSYIAPEQTGRMNRSVDGRADLYSLGVTLFELATGRLPFVTDDALEMVHWHTARQAPSALRVREDLPPVVAHIIQRLMAKNPEDRYQGTTGLLFDLQRCKERLDQGSVSPFDLGTRDVSERFEIPERLYGREAQVAALLEAYETSADGEPTLVTVTGPAGIGKSALVRELYRPITARRGVFASGKFEQLHGGVPYTGLLQAMRSLVQHVLGGTEGQLAHTRRQLLRAFDGDGAVLVDMCPELSALIGDQPAVAEVAPKEARHRFSLLLRRFFTTLARPDQPLCVFLDDLQWADEDSLEMVEDLLAEADTPLLVVAAWRDDEVAADHPVHALVTRSSEGGVQVVDLPVDPLSAEHVTRLAADALRCGRDRAEPLAALLVDKTLGNPFFLRSYLRRLHQDGLLSLDDGAWRWELGELRVQELADNAVDLVARGLDRLPDETRAALEVAACLGNPVRLSQVEQVHGAQAGPALWSAVQTGLLLPTDEGYQVLRLDDRPDGVEVSLKFAHDKVQQAVYESIPEERRLALHLRLGRSARARLEHDGAGDARLFDVVHHLGRGLAALDDPEERRDLAELCDRAISRARRSAAWDRARGLADLGRSALGDERWSRHPDIARSLTLHAAETAFLDVAYEAMEGFLAELLEHATSDDHRVPVHTLRAQVGYATFQLQDAVKHYKDALSALGMPLPEPSMEAIGAEGMATAQAIGDRSTADLATLPEMTDPVSLTAMKTLGDMSFLVMMTEPMLYPIVIYRQVQLTAEHGIAPGSPMAFAMYGVLQFSFGDIDGGCASAATGLKLAEGLSDRGERAKARMTADALMTHWTVPLHRLVAGFRQAARDALAAGDLYSAANGLATWTIAGFLSGTDLTTLADQGAQSREAIVRYRQAAIQGWLEPYLQAIENLRRTDLNDPVALSGELYDEAVRLPAKQQAGDGSGLFNYHTVKLFLAVIFGDAERALHHADAVQAVFASAAVSIWAPPVTFLDAIARLMSLDGADEEQAAPLREAVEARLATLRTWAERNPEVCRHKVLLIEAELARIDGRLEDARTAFDQAVEAARKSGVLHEEALAFELAAAFHGGCGRPKLTRYYYRDAHYAWARWGAVAKVRDLELQHPALVPHVTTGSMVSTTTTTTTMSGNPDFNLLDLIGVLNASQALSGEMELEKLLIRLMKLVLESAGAERGLLILRKGEAWGIAVEGSIEVGQTRVLRAVPLHSRGPDGAPMLPAALVHKVARTGEAEVIGDATRDRKLAHDPYVLARQPRSILALPMQQQGRTRGVLYVENRLLAGAFTPGRIEVLRFLASQAAISIENAQLYGEILQLNQAYERFVPRQFLQLLDKDSITDVELGDSVQRTMTVLFSDIRSFTALSEKMTPEENFRFINAYLQRQEPVLSRHGGFIDKYIGDAIMGLFSGTADDAVRAGVQMLRELAVFNTEREARGEVAIEIGVGLNTGPLMMGTVGGRSRMDGTVISDTVNVAARVEGLTKTWKVGLMITGDTMGAMQNPEEFCIRLLGTIAVRNRTQPLRVYEVFDADPEPLRAAKLRSRNRFEEGVLALDAEDKPSARAAFAEVIAACPDDAAAASLLQRTHDRRA